jgi:hypothetical protein
MCRCTELNLAYQRSGAPCDRCQFKIGSLYLGNEHVLKVLTQVVLQDPNAV